MSNETTKATARRVRSGIWYSIIKGVVIDIGCGPDPLRKDDWPEITDLVLFDQDRGSGDANGIDAYFPVNHFDCVHGSQVLEHLHNPMDALVRMLRITKPGGYVVMTVPDFDIYEKGIFPSVNNSDHKSTWSLWRQPAPTDYPHVFVPALAIALNNVHVTANLCVDRYNWMDPAHDQTLGAAECFIEMVIRKNP